MNNFKKYLPSKNFIAIVIIIILFIGLFLTIRGVISFFKNRKRAMSDAPIEMTIGNLIQKDGNKNGIADWEEYLWGLDPNKNGPENKEFILAKKKTLEENGIISTFDDSKAITDNELLNQQFFAAIISLQQTGNLNEESMKSVAEAVGKNIDPTPLPDTYTSSMLTIQNDSDLANTTYNNNFSKLVTKYADADIGSELTFVIQGISNKDPQALYAAKTVADAYLSFGEELLTIPVPRSISTIHLSMANNYQKMGEITQDLTKTLTDPLLGMKAIVNYKKYSDALASDLERLSNVLQ